MLPCFRRYLEFASVSEMAPQHTIFARAHLISECKCESQSNRHPSEKSPTTSHPNTDATHNTCVCIYKKIKAGYMFLWRCQVGIRGFPVLHSSCSCHLFLLLRRARATNCKHRNWCHDTLMLLLQAECPKHMPKSSWGGGGGESTLRCPKRHRWTESVYRKPLPEKPGYPNWKVRFERLNHFGIWDKTTFSYPLP